MSPRVRTGLLVALPAILYVGTVAIVTAVSSIRTTELTRDPAAQAGFPFYFGAFSHLGVLLWCAAASICFLAWTLLGGVDREAARYFLESGLLTALFGLDDLFLLHEDAFPRLGIDEMVVIGAYGLAGLAYVVRWYARIVGGGASLLVAAVVFLGLSVLIDLWDPPDLDIMFEDGFKLLGIGCWLGHFARAAARALRPRPEEFLLKSP
ncbi:MAG: hypothetical protein ABR559_06290 [Gemmatimonadota bacterium]